MYVDDVLLYITTPDLLDTFGTNADNKVNIQKTQVTMFYYNPSSELKEYQVIGLKKQLNIWEFGYRTVVKIYIRKTIKL